MSLYQKLVQQEKDLQARHATILEAVETAGEWSDEQRAEADQLENQLAAVRGDIRRSERDRDDKRSAHTTPIDSDEAEAAEIPAPTPFRSLGEQLLAVAAASTGHSVHRGLSDLQRYGAATGLNETVGSEGGFLVQPDYTTELLREAMDSAMIASRTRRRPVTGNGIVAKAVKESSRADGSRMGGIQAFWEGEGATITKSKPAFREIDMKLRKLTGLYYATDELLQDAPALEGEVQDWFEEEFSFKLDDAVVRGTGVGMPLGFLEAPALVTVAKEAGQTADTIVAANLQKMFARVPARSLARAVWIINQEVWPQLFGIEDTEGHRIFMGPRGLADAPLGTILGRPIVVAEQASALGDVGDVNLVDLQRYLLIEKAGGIQAAVSIHVKFEEAETAFRFILRANGQPIPDTALTPYKGASTLSPFVTLAERA